jgi:site-specific DNA-methyltransferase (adenine-specific)
VTVRLIIGDVREKLCELGDESVHCVVTSPPYFQQRDYGLAGQIGVERTPKEFIIELVSVFRQVRRVLRADGTLWLNLGDSRAKRSTDGANRGDLLGLPWRIALALQADGWALRQDVIWHKVRPMPDGATDRPSSAHEYLFLLGKGSPYFYDAAAVMEVVSPNSHGGKKHNPGSKALSTGNHTDGSLGLVRTSGLRNRRSVWSIIGTPFPGAHCAPFPPELVEPCIKAGSPDGGIVLDPFAGSGTVGLVSDRLNRSAILIELNPAYAEIAQRRIDEEAGMFSQITA